jgi:4-amino-4-deoxy-L-arabinose transferase-like glycosyltransferase
MIATQMTGRRILAPILALVLLAAAFLYTTRLDRVPPFLSTDETSFALEAHAIATTARDQNGRLLPLYFQIYENIWFHPALVYAMAPILAVTPPSPTAVRLPTVIVALAGIFLLYVLTRRLGASRGAAAVGALLLALTPAHFMHGRLACDYLFPVPFVLGWLILLVDAQRLQSSWRFFAAGALLGIGLYTYIASVMMMPVYLLLTYVTLFAAGARNVRPFALVTAGFTLLVVPLALYLLAMPEVYAGFVGRYAKATVNVDVVQHPLALFSARLVDEWWPTYRSFFERRFLFEHAETHLLSSTYTTGIFMKAMQVLIPLGLFHILRNRRTPFTWLLLATFFTAPLAASMIPEKYAIDRALMLVVSGAIIATFGIDWLLLPRPRFAAWPAGAACVALVGWTVFQFNDFYRDYLTEYPKRAAFWFDGNHPGAFAPLVDQHTKEDQRFIYLSARLPRIEDHWKLYLLRRDRADLLKRTVYFSDRDLQLAFVKPGSLLLTGADDAAERTFLKLQAVRPVTQITEPDGTPSFTIFERTEWAGLYRFDGTYSVKVDVTCSTGKQPCNSAAVPAPCLHTITVANGLVSDNCGYLRPAAIADDGRYDGAETNFGIALSGIFDTNGAVRLSGSGQARDNRYEFILVLTKQN